MPKPRRADQTLPLPLDFALPAESLDDSSTVALAKADQPSTKLNASQLSALSSQLSPFPQPSTLTKQLASFQQFGQQTIQTITHFDLPEVPSHAKRLDTSQLSTFNSQLPAERAGQVPTFVNEFWTAQQRQAHSLHEVSYRACFKPQLPRFFIERLTDPGDLVYDPFMGRGTTLIEAALLGRVPAGNDANPLSLTFTRPRLRPPTLSDVEKRLREIDLNRPADYPEDLLVFYHPETLREISSLKHYLVERRSAGLLDPIDDWVALVALNRLTGHSPGFFSVYTLPPNQAVSVKSQRRINERRGQVPPRRDVARIILKKSRQLLGDLDDATRITLGRVAPHAQLHTCPADHTPDIKTGSVALVVTSPPFLNVVQYSVDNWLRCWFLGIDPKSVRLTLPSKLEDWAEAMTRVLCELKRIVRPGGHVAFEVGEVHSGQTRLEETVLTCGTAAGLNPLLVLINQQVFTKTANCWGVDNMTRGTNTNRIVVFRND